MGLRLKLEEEEGKEISKFFYYYLMETKTGIGRFTLGMPLSMASH